MTAPDELRAQAEYLARELWGEAAQVHGPTCYEYAGDPALFGTWSASAYACPGSDAPIGICVRYVESREMAEAVLVGALRAALRKKTTHGMATCGPVSVDADGREVSHVRG